MRDKTFCNSKDILNLPDNKSQEEQKTNKWLGKLEL